MANPIFGPFGQQPPSQPTGIMGMISQIRNSPNPDAAMQQMINSNPQFQNVMQYINQNGGDARAAFYNMAAQKGVDPDSILAQLR